MIEAKILKGDRLVFQSVANTKQEAESDLLYQLMNYFDFSIHINPDYNPTNPTKDKFIDDIFEIAFGDTMLKAELLEEHDYQEVTNKIMEYSDNALKWEQEENMLDEFIKTLNLEEEEDYFLNERLQRFIKEQN
jgi:ATP-dependent Lon protease